MRKIIKYSFYDLARSRWSYVYLMFYLLVGFLLLFLNAGLSNAIITLLNIVLILTPLIGTVFGVMYVYSSREFTELLLAQPLKRSTIFLGQYLGISISLSLSLFVGLGIPFVLYGLFQSAEIFNFLILLFAGVALTFIFVAISFLISLKFDNKIKGFGLAILAWLFLAIMYDGLFITFMVLFSDYPLEKYALAATVFNPIDLSRILILLKLDISALLGYTGAVFKSFLGNSYGMVISFLFLLLWVVLPLLFITKTVNKKDF
ncbi:MAG: ABC transporter permease subunit [Cyclobacteriaceae bacterium]|nr:ABC transporter permease subunit [Cyclobacteriaceae bacterium]